MRRFKETLLMLIAAFAIGGGLVGCDAKNVNRMASNTSPRATMQSFINCCKSGDLNKAQTYFCSSLRSQMSDTDDAAAKLGLAMIFNEAYISSVEEGYGSATVYVKIKNPVNDEWENVPIPMTLEDGSWKITEIKN